MKLIPYAIIVFVLTGLIQSCKHPTDPKQPVDTTTHDTTHHDSGSHDTGHIKAPDTTSHSFIWTEYSIPSESSINTVCVNGPEDIYVIGSGIYRFDGSKWNPIYPKNQNGTEIGGESGMGCYGFSATDFWTAGGSIVEHITAGTDGKLKAQEWRPNVQGGYLHACWGTSSTDMYCVGDNGTIIHFDGANWTNFPKVTSKKLLSISGTSSSNIWCCGYDVVNGNTILLHYDGATWQEDSLSSASGINATGGFDAVWSGDSSGHATMLTAGAKLARRTQNQNWRFEDGACGNKLGNGEYIGLFGIRGNTTNDIFVAGDGGFISHWNGRSWLRYDAFFNSGDPLYGTNSLSLSGSTVCCAGFKDGQSWILVGQRK